MPCSDLFVCQKHIGCHQKVSINFNNKTFSDIKIFNPMQGFLLLLGQARRASCFEYARFHSRLGFLFAQWQWNGCLFFCLPWSWPPRWGLLAIMLTAKECRGWGQGWQRSGKPSGPCWPPWRKTCRAFRKKMNRLPLIRYTRKVAFHFRLEGIKLLCT